MRNKIIGTVCLVLGIVVIVSTGTSFAYFNTSANPSGDDITGTTMNFDVDLKVEEIYSANQLVPLEDNLIQVAVNNKCVDSHGYEVCALYKITLTNNGDPQILNGHITSAEDTTYITNHLKGQLFNENLTNTISKMLTITDEDQINTENKRYFHIDDTNLYTTEVTTTETLYLAIWLTETHTYQNDDYDKDYFGKIAFESINGEMVSSTFSA